MMISLPTLLYGLTGLALVAAGFGAGYLWSWRRWQREDIRHSYVMAGYFLSTIQAMRECRHDLVADGLRTMARSHLECWSRHKRRLPQSERVKLQELCFAGRICEGEEHLRDTGEL